MAFWHHISFMLVDFLELFDYGSVSCKVYLGAQHY